MIQEEANIGSLFVPQLGNYTVFGNVGLAAGGMGCVQSLVHAELAVLIAVRNDNLFVGHAQFATVADRHIDRCIRGRFYLGWYIRTTISQMVCLIGTAIFSTGNEGTALTGMTRTISAALGNAGQDFLGFCFRGKCLDGYISHQHDNCQQHRNDSFHTLSSIYFRKCIFQFF